MTLEPYFLSLVFYACRSSAHALNLHSTHTVVSKENLDVRTGWSEFQGESVKATVKKINMKKQNEKKTSYTADREWFNVHI